MFVIKKTNLFAALIFAVCSLTFASSEAQDPDHANDVADFDLYDRNREGMDWKDWKEDYGRRDTRNDDEGYTLSDPDYQFYNKEKKHRRQRNTQYNEYYYDPYLQ